MQCTIDTLPLEILGEIIVLALDSTFWDSLAFDEEAGRCITVYRVQEIQNRLALVSMRFRQAALLDPRYWRTVVFIINPSGDVPPKLAKGEAAQRSGSFPLRLLLSFHPDTDLSTQDWIFSNAYTSILPMYMERISSLVICLPNINFEPSTWHDFINRVARDILRTGNNRLALLGIYACSEILQRNNLFPVTGRRRGQIVPLFELPGLHSISTNFSLMGYVATTTGHPIKNCFSLSKRLTHLRFGLMSLPWFLQVLRQGAQLEELRVQHIYSIVAGGDGLEPVVHGRLAALCIEQPCDKRLLSFLTLPSLKQLELTPHQAQDTYPASWPGSPAEISFFDSCLLERLVIWHGPLNPRLVQIIRTQENLLELTFEHFHEHGSDEDVTGARAMAPSLPNDVIAFLHAPNLPHLHSISLVVTPAQLPTLRQMLLSRKEAEQKGEVASLVFLSVTVWNEAHMCEGESREYMEALKSGWKHREFLDDILEEF